MFKRKDKAKGIYKMQRPLSASDGNYNQILVYQVDEAGDQVGKAHQFNIPKEQIERIFADYMKVYYHAQIDKNNKLEIADEAMKDEWV